MNINKLSPILSFIFLFLCPIVCPQEVVNNQENNLVTANVVEEKITLPVSSTKEFVAYLKQAINSVASENKKQRLLMQARVVKVEGLCTRINEYFEQGAFAELPAIKEGFYKLFENFDTQAWPNPSTVRSWKKRFEDYKKFLHQTCYLDASSYKRTHIEVATLESLHFLNQELTRYIFTNKFFDFSFIDLALDCCLLRPFEFIQKNPGTVLLGVTAVVAIGGSLYLCFPTQPINHLKSGKQKGAECGWWMLFNTWCIDQATVQATEQKDGKPVFNDALFKTRFSELSNDVNSFEQFRAEMKKILPAADNQWLASDDVPRMLDYMLEPGHAFTITERPLFIGATSAVDLSQEYIDDIRYRDTDRVYTADDVPENRKQFCTVEFAGDRHTRLKQRIQNFNAQPGSIFCADVLLNQAPDMTHWTLEQKSNYKATNGGHYIAIAAVNDQSVDADIKFFVADSASSMMFSQKNNVIDYLRRLLAPFNE